MASVFWDVIDGYSDLMEKRDRRSDGWFLMSSPFPTLALCACYVYFVKVLGPRLMKDRPAFELKSSIIVYNIVQVVFSTWLLLKGLRHSWFMGRYNIFCQPYDPSDDPDEYIVAECCWWYYFCKFTEFLDTIFFVLRKKNDQITTLHVIHHTIMPAATWWGVKFFPGGHGTFFGLLNTTVHIIMYTYYLIAAMGPKYQKYIWWKKHLTTIQMIQFATVFVHSAQIFFNGCDYPKHLMICTCFHSILFFGLFSNFYIQAYIKQRRLPPNTKGTASKDSKIMNGQTSSSGIKKNIQNFMVQATKSCYIGQNGLVPDKKTESLKAKKID